MDIITYQNINQILGDEKKRFFSYGFKLARHHFKNVEYDWTNGEENSACKIVYSGVWSQKKEHTTEPHLTTLDGLLIALYMSENFIRKLFGLSEKELEHAWICELHMKSGANAVYKLNKISVHCQYKGTKKKKIK
ncbi:AvrD family protein [Terrilactibacillus sp. S3-3]|nr:AvrD family protein [Terrilactibacillus sp. S3-3]